MNCIFLDFSLGYLPERGTSMADPVQKVEGVLKANRILRNHLNQALDDIYAEAQLGYVSPEDNKKILDLFKEYIVSDQNFNNIHIHWSS